MAWDEVLAAWESWWALAWWERGRAIPVGDCHKVPVQQLVFGFLDWLGWVIIGPHLGLVWQG